MPAVPRYAAKPQVFTSWSFSRWSDYNSCPKKAYFKHIASKSNPALKEPENEAMARGSFIHGLAQHYITGEVYAETGKKVTRIPAELAPATDLLKELKAQRKKAPGTVVVEDNWAFRKDWSQTVWNDWNGCAVRIKLDAAYSVGTDLHIVDWKTGKFSEYKLEDYMIQQELYALSGLLKFPKIERVLPTLNFTDAGVVYPRVGTDDPEFVFTRKDEARLIKVWDRRVAPMLKDTSFKEKPGDACKFCFYKKANGGPCKY